MIPLNNLSSRTKYEKNDFLNLTSPLKTQNLKAKLQNCFGDKLSFWAPKGKSGIVYSEETPSTMKSSYENTHADMIANCGKIIRNEIMNLSDPFSHWPPAEKELLFL